MQVDQDADVVDAARERGIEVTVVWPEFVCGQVHVTDRPTDPIEKLG